jgi:iron complex outermembrane receptor protein
MKGSLKTALATSAALGCVVVYPTSALAQDQVASPGASDESVATEIIVTAQRREERLQDVPLAVTALTAEELQNSRIENVQDLEERVSSLTFTQSTNEQNSSLRIRGVGTSLFGTGFEPSVSIVLDGVVLARQGQGFVDLIDLERVEVLRGPQGTLFGKNATAGVVNITTRRPSSDFEVFGDVTVAERDEYRVRGSVSGPIGTTLGARLTGFYSDVGGHILNRATGEFINGSESYGARGQLEWDATPDLNLLLIGDYRKSETTCCQYQSRSIGNPVFLAAIAPVVPGPENNEVNVDAFVGGGTEQYGASLQGTLDFGFASLVSISAYRTWDFSNNQDVDGTNNPVPVLGVTQLNLNGGTTDIRQFSQELRLDSAGGGPIQYTLGLYYFGLEIDRYFARRIGACVPSPLPPLNQNIGLLPGQTCRQPIFTSFDFNSAIENEHYAAFGQVTWNLTDQFSLIGGLRYQYEEQRARGVRPGLALFPGDLDLDPTTPNTPFPPSVNPLSPLRPSSGSAQVDDKVLTGRAGVQYRFTRDAQVYATYTRGYKGRAFDTEITSDFANLVALQPETVDAYEVGAKYISPDRRLNINLAAFFSQYENLQIQAFDRDAALFRPINAGSSDVKGVEVEFTLRPTEGFSVAGGLTLLDATTDINGIACYPGQTTITQAAGGPRTPGTCYRETQAVGPVTVSQDVRGGDLPNAPDVRLNLATRYEGALTQSLGWFAQTSLQMQDDVLFDVNQDPLTVQDGYVTVDASIGLTGPDERWTLTAFVENLFDENYVAAIARDPLSPVSTIQFRPKDADRYFGASLRFRF